MRIVSLLVWARDRDEAQRSSAVDKAPTPVAGDGAGDGQGGTEETREAGLVGARGEEHRG
jgi:hypothetical protein